MATANSDEAHLLRRHLAEHDARCPVCNACLRGVQSTGCPGCGADLHLRVGSIDLKLGWWVATLVGLSMTLGMATFSSVVGACTLIWEAVTTTATRPFRAQTGVALALPSMGVVVMVGLLAALTWMLVRRRRRFMSMPRRRQVICAIAALVAFVPVAAGIVGLFQAMWR